MKLLPILILIPFLFSGCHAVMSTAMSAKTGYVVEALHSERELLDVPKSDSYKITTIIECPDNQKVLYKTQYTLVIKDGNGNLTGEGEKSKGHVTSFSTTQEVKAGTIWAYKTEFKTPITNGKFIVKVGDSTIINRTLTGKDINVDYGFQLP